MNPNPSDPTLAARFFFRNCSVSIHLPGELRIARTNGPGVDDVILDRDFIPAKDPSEFIGKQSDFFRFLDGTSPSNSELVKKLCAIGYMLCNKRYHRLAHHSFICVNEDSGAFANGKTLFANAVAQLCNPVTVSLRDLSRVFGLSAVDNGTTLLIVDEVPPRSHLIKLFSFCTADWEVNRKGQPTLVIPSGRTPYLLVTSSVSLEKLRSDRAFRRRFVPLVFSSMFGPGCPIDKYIGRTMFHDWDSAQWHMFDNFMFYCVIEYLRRFDGVTDVFSRYEWHAPELGPLC